MTRDSLKEASIEAIKKHNNIAIQAGTGVGKSKIALEALKSINNINNVLIVVAERAHISNWEKEISKWGIHFNNITIICYASLKKLTNTTWDGIIYDEAHHLSSSLRLEILKSVTSKYKVFLSATLKESLIYSLEESIDSSIYSIKLGLQEAIDSDILPEPKIFLIPLELNNTNYTEVIVEEWGRKDKRVSINCLYKDRWKYIRSKTTIPNCTLNIQCTQRQKYDYLSEQFEYYKRRYLSCRNEALKNKWLQCGSKRKTYLGITKTNIAVKVLNRIKNKRFICFCANIDQASALGKDNAIHSKKTNNSIIIEKFNNSEINNLFAVGMLQEGQNLNNIQAGLIIQLDGEERSFIQRFGRVLRSNNPEQYILYYKNTRDEEYLKNALEGIKQDYIKELNYDNFNKR